jgi:hypothetical protein
MNDSFRCSPGNAGLAFENRQNSSRTKTRHMKKEEIPTSAALSCASLLKENRHSSSEKCRSSRLVLQEVISSNQFIEDLKRMYDLVEVCKTEPDE